MAELNHSAADFTPDPSEVGVETVLPVAECRDLLVVLGKALRAYQLYDENNPVRQRFVESLRQALREMWTELDNLPLTVEEDRLLLEGAEVYRAESRGDSLAFLFFKDGVRKVTFLPGLEGDELERFLGVLQKARKLLPEGDDLLTVLWEEDLSHFKYEYVDFLAEGVALPVPGEGNTEAELAGVLSGEMPEDAEDEGPESARAREASSDQPSRSVATEDFNPTLYALDPRELTVLREELQKELDRDLRGDVLSALFDRLEETGRPQRQTEILGHLGTLLPNFLSRGTLTGATRVLEELRRLEGTPGVFDEERLAASRRILDEASAPAAIGELIQALYDGSIRSTPQQLAAFLRFLRVGALLPLLRASETVDHKELRSVLRAAARGIAERNKTALVRLMEEEDPVVAAGAAHLAGDLQVEEAGPALAGLMAHPSPDVRLAAVEAAVSLKASTAAGALEHTLEDPERELRIAAARALGALRYRPAAKKLEGIVTGKGIRSVDVSEKVAFFEAYGLVGDKGALDVLDKLLNGRGFLGRREPPDIRAAAALALGKVTDAGARDALMRASQEDDPVVRSAVNRALRSED